MHPTLPFARLLRRVVPALALGVPLVACTWSVPADPGRNAVERGAAAAPAATPAPRPASVAVATTDDGTRALYERKCGQCHAPFEPRFATPAQWPGFVRSYGPRAGLFGEERARVTRYLQEASR